MKKSRHDNLDYASLLKQKEARMERLKNSKNPFIICTFLKKPWTKRTPNCTTRCTSSTLRKNSKSSVFRSVLALKTRRKRKPKLLWKALKSRTRSTSRCLTKKRSTSLSRYHETIQGAFSDKNRKPVNKIQNALFIDNAVNEQLKLINTGEDAISFFAKYGNSNLNQYILLNLFNI